MMLLRLLAVAAPFVLVILACSPAPDASPPATPSPAPIASTTPAPTTSARPPPAPPIASPGPLDSKTVPAWTDPAAIAALAIDCNVAVKPVTDDGDANPLSCSGQAFEQSCAPDLCLGATSACHQDCQATCGTCADACVTSCGTCKSPCTDDACRTVCATSAGACRQACLTTRDTCTSGACGDVDAKCQKGVAAKAKACGFEKRCASLEACTDRIFARCPADAYSDCSEKVRADCYKLIAPCPIDYAWICAALGPKYFDADH